MARVCRDEAEAAQETSDDAWKAKDDARRRSKRTTLRREERRDHVNLFEPEEREAGREKPADGTRLQAQMPWYAKMKKDVAHGERRRPPRLDPMAAYVAPALPAAKPKKSKRRRDDNNFEDLRRRRLEREAREATKAEELTTRVAYT